MHTKNLLQLQAIKAAKSHDWAEAIRANQDILQFDSQDIGALNRLGMAFLQQGDKKEAVATFKRVLEIDSSHALAKKHLDRLNHNQHIPIPTFSNNSFIEEPGKTRTVELHRLASKDVLDSITVGATCELKPKNRYISVEVNEQYIGALPEDLSFRLTKLMANGNTYAGHIRSVDSTVCLVFLRETKRSTRNQHINSFPITKTYLTTINDVDETYLQEQDSPLQLEDGDGEEDRGSFDGLRPTE